ncbi:type VI secretion system Vgr family protein [Paraliomyxa miuraensis]|uniref:type VI secretion system Vgr family protein n=1 Tax=Paraliomyxa miuraensis TaxID=376150 RepID=UPI00224E015A|nr:type VI secretion system tip protein TssI/VgrG [Paraliomyxa miuraensis]MCX4241901.1 type VI secretion system tip protein VgrG [Paraliomyxa miuraensis]
MANDERDPNQDRNQLEVRPLAEPPPEQARDADDERAGATSPGRSPSSRGARRSASDASATDALAAAASRVFGEPLETVSYQLRVHDGPDPGWHVRRVHLREAISEPYALMVDLITDDVDLETDELLGADVELELTRNTFARRVPGIVERVDFLDVASDRLEVRLHVVPAFRLLEHHVDTRIFQDKSVPDILAEVLEPALAQYGRKLDRSKLGGTYLVRDYCVQYGESDLAFANRLMEEEGIAYLFEPEGGDDGDGGAEVLVLLDQNPDEANADYPEMEGDILDQIPIITDRPETADCESLRYLEWFRPERPTKLSTRRYNWKRPDPKKPPVAEQQREAKRQRVREIYAPDPRRRIVDYQGRDSYRGTRPEDDEEPLTLHRFEILTRDLAWGTGASNVTCLRAGGVFEIAEHPHDGVSYQRLLVTRAIHVGDCPDREMGATSDGIRYENKFECIPAATPFRARELTPKPRIHGPQTALVTGPAGEEIHTDVHGRIKVSFHWDRIQPQDDGSSCWVRVAQMWAGPGWGTWFLPRIGMEVVVEFLDGNPDRPLVTGCVYNGRNQTPYPLPEDKTKSTLKSNSSVGGDGFNELRFEDAKGKEEIFIHAQRDQNERVLSNRTRLVKGNEWITIEGNTMVKIDGHPVHGEAQGIVQGRETKIDGHEILETTHTVHVRAPERIVLEVPGSSIVLEPGSITLTAGDGASIRLDQDILAMSKERSTMELSKGIVIDTAASMELQGGDVTVIGETEVVVRGGVIRLN